MIRFDPEHGWQDVLYLEAAWLGFSEDGQHMAVIGEGNRVYMWNMSKGAEVREYQVMPGLVANGLGATAVWSPDGQQFAYYSDYMYDTLLWHLNISGLWGTYQVLEEVDSICWSLDGRLLATTLFDAVILWTRKDGQYHQRQVLNVTNQSKCDPLAFSPDGMYLAGLVSYINNTRALHVWHQLNGAWSVSWVLMLSVERSAVFKWHPDSQRLAISTDGLPS